MRAHRVDLADDPDRHPFLGGRQCCSLAGETGPDYENVMGWHGRGCYTAESRGRSRDSSRCNPSRWGSGRGWPSPDTSRYASRLRELSDQTFGRVLPPLRGGLPLDPLDLLEPIPQPMTF